MHDQDDDFEEALYEGSRLDSMEDGWSIQDQLELKRCSSKWDFGGTGSRGRKVEKVKLVKAGVSGHRVTWKHPRRSHRWNWRESFLDAHLIGEEALAASEWEARQPQVVRPRKTVKRRPEAMPTIYDFQRPREEEVFTDGFGDAPPYVINVYRDASIASGIN